jgi:predicted alpha/beta-hydrolase family hydrolase
MAKRKRGQKKASNETGTVDRQDVGGRLKDPTGNSPSAGEDDSVEEGASHLQIPFNGKVVVCEKRGGTESGNDKVSLIFTHGAGGGIKNPATKDFVTGFASVVPHIAVCFQGTMNLKHRTRTFHAVVENQGAAVALGGRSMGARAAVITAAECKADERPEALILVSYPLSAGGQTPKKQHDGDPRKQILLDVPSDIDVLFVAGSEDNQCHLDELESVRKEMNARSWLLEVKGADHGMSLKTKDGIQLVRLRTGALAAEWLEKRDDNMRYCVVAWDDSAKEIAFDGWRGEKLKSNSAKRRKK